MDSLPLHPKLVHLPIALAVITPAMAIALLFAWWRGLFRQRTWVVAVALQAMLVGGGYAALASGEADEEAVERVVPEIYIEQHEEAAEQFLWAGVAVLAPMVLALVIPRRRPALGMAALAAAGTVVVLWLGYRTGEAGGRLVYRHGAATAWAAPSDAALPAHAHTHPEDDDD